MWLNPLADRLQGRKVLEIMSGPGHLGAELSARGVDIICTDDYSWYTMHGRVLDYPVQMLSDIDAIEKYRHSDVLLCSWPPYQGEEFTEACRAWGPKKDIVFIGEGERGCTADDSFFDGFRSDECIPMTSWDGIHDNVEIGRFYDN
jgi:hypothetical protein